jgi:hypothetical protein
MVITRAHVCVCVLATMYGAIFKVLFLFSLLLNIIVTMRKEINMQIMVKEKIIQIKIMRIKNNANNE